ncbi:alpha-D-ribose 1-methylphosphonate 5-triphosphate diphosphatase [Rhodalgimonas zhirmunskyi]|uniref:Alpha-D-ribose 1-methylphosphonate 5-triphosphate diphosphatase n=1 Tax=Rhodalgimonas zhirmunskyi TaxID=2964767 RepID=A0AAJ1UAT1_9RHOB|nr:alpha-D-ribose 1-methylphosphonate 5-triphosphate diphosphatase [Rhodoalgimonas zhirmunskyi]MDQ2095040.1 alpha-D-ribose 1-methylphosphonate 5-triphosphate diphosphatase [Rhodoalgimonas zhirmunskyi]
MSLSLRLEGAEVLRPGGLIRGSVGIDGGLLCDDLDARGVDLSGYRILPGIVDLHGDAFERHLAPRRGAMKDMEGGLRAAHAELAASGITTAVLAQFWSWEGGMRSPDFAQQMFGALGRVADAAVIDMRAQLRFEINMVDDYAAVEEAVARHGIGYVVFNDHLPHERLSKGQKPKRLTGMALKAARSPEAHWAMMQALEDRRGEVPALLDGLAARLGAAGVRLGSHDDHTADDRAAWRARGVRIAEFPETQDAAEAAQAAGEGVILGAPNVMRGGSHKGNASALDLITMGLADAIASDYHYPSLFRAALFLAASGLMEMPAAWGLVSSGPARLLGLSDRGTIAAGKRADLVILDAADQVAAVIAGGRVAHMSGDVAARFLG